MDFDDLLLRLQAAARRHPSRAAAARRALPPRAGRRVPGHQPAAGRHRGPARRRAPQPHAWWATTRSRIYGFRGADFANIIDFPERYPDARRLRPHAQLPLDAARSSSSRTPPSPTTCASSRSAPGVARRGRAAGARARAATCSSRPPSWPSGCSSCARRACRWREMAVLYRAHCHSMELQLELTRRGIPFRGALGRALLRAAHIKDVLAHLRSRGNPRDELALKRALKLVPGIGTASADAVWNALAARRRGGTGGLDELPRARRGGARSPPKGRAGYRRLVGPAARVRRGRPPPTRRRGHRARPRGGLQGAPRERVR